MISVILAAIIGATGVQAFDTEADVVLRMPLNSASEGRDYSYGQETFVETGTPVYGSSSVTLDGTEYLKLTEANWRSDTSGTFCAWVSTTDNTTAADWFSTSDEASTTRLWFLGIFSPGLITLGSRDGGTFNRVVGTTVLQNNTTYHVCFESDGTTWTASIDGSSEPLSISLGSNTGDWYGDIPNRDSVLLGALERTTVEGEWSGTIGCVEVWSSPIGSTGWLSDYNQGCPAAKQKAFDSEADLVLHLPCDDNSTTQDHGRDNFTFTASGTPVYASTGCTLQAAGPDYLTQTVSNYRESDSEGSVCFWANPTDGVNSSIWSVADSGSDDDYLTIDLLMLTDDSVQVLTRIGASTTADIRALGVVDAGSWNHYCVVSSGTAYSIYKNGVAQVLTVSAGANTGDWLGDFGAGTINNMTVGRLNRSTPAFAAELSAYGISYYNASVQPLVLYSQGHPAAKEQAPGWTKGIVFYAPLDTDHDAGATSVRDLSATQATCTGSGDPVIASTGTTFDGNDEFNCGSHTGHEFTEADSFSVALWVNGASDGGFTEILTKRQIADRYEIAFESDDDLRCSISDGSTDVNVVSTTAQNGAWHHVVLTHDGTDLECFIDGTSIGTAATAGLSGVDVAGGDLRIGQGVNGGLVGQATDVLIWNYVIPQSVINYVSDSSQRPQ